MLGSTVKQSWPNISVIMIYGLGKFAVRQVLIVGFSKVLEVIQFPLSSDSCVSL